MTLLRKIANGKRLVARAHEALRNLDPRIARMRREVARDRERSLAALDRFSRESPTSQCAAKVLVDGMWDNANYWLRYALVRRALGLTAASEVGLLGQYSRDKVRASFEALSIREVVDYRETAQCSPQHRADALTLLANVKTPADFLKLRLPADFPPELVFDGILKRQRCATVDLNDPALPDYLAEVLAFLEAADGIVGAGGFNLVILSHALDYTYTAIAWAALRRNVPLLVLYGDFGVARFIRIKDAADLFAYPARPTTEEIERMPQQIRSLLRDQGAAQMRARLSGRTDDVGAVYAYQRRRGSVDKALLAERFGWDPAKPVIGVYNANWFDYPHGGGLHYFRDFLEWIEETLAVAGKNSAVNWLFKAHPCDDWYASIKGTRLEDLVAAANLPHVRLSDKTWNGLDLIRTLDGIVTCHGTIGIEAAAMGTPVLVAYAGWYGHAGFVVNPGNKSGYLSALKSEWWKSIDSETARIRAELFAGWMFCAPDWHLRYILQDDSRQDAIYPGMCGFLEENKAALEKEVREIRAWFDSGHRYFHVFKMARAAGYQQSNRILNEATS